MSVFIDRRHICTSLYIIACCLYPSQLITGKFRRKKAQAQGSKTTCTYSGEEKLDLCLSCRRTDLRCHLVPFADSF